MKKLALIGAVAALALVGGQAYALDELEVNAQVPVATGDGAVAVGVSDALNGNKLFSDNEWESTEFTKIDTDITKVFAPKYEYESSLRIEVGDIQVNKAEIKQVVPDAAIGVFAVPFLGVSGAQSQNGPSGHGDDNNSDPSCCALSVYTGAISGGQVSGKGIMGVGLNTGIANQAAVSQINIGKVYSH